MKGFGIYVQNDLLEPKHYKNMREAVWLYMWFLDKMTSINENGEGKILGNKPITYLDVQPDLGIHRNTYAKYIGILREAGYITTLRTPRGLCILVLKAKKGSTRTSASPKSVMHTNVNISAAHEHVQQKHSDAHDSVHAEDAHDSVHPIKTKQSRLNNREISTNVLIGETPIYGKPEINEMFDYWKERTGVGIESNVKRNRHAASNLYKKYGFEKLRSLVDGVALAQSTPYAPRIADYVDLQAKLTQLLTWGKSRSLEPTGGIVKV